MRRLPTILLTSVLFAGAAALLPLQGAGAAATSVPVPLNGSAATGFHPVVSVQIGSNAPVKVVLDTGSVGLHVFASRLSPGGASSGIASLDTGFVESFVDGTIFRGTVGQAVVALGGLTTAVPIPVGIVTSVGCTKKIPNCPTKTMPTTGVAGVMGIGTDSPGPSGIASPLLAMPGSGSWSLHFSGAAGTLTLGAVTPQGATTFELASEGTTTLISGSTVVTEGFWNDKQGDACYTVGSVAPVCQGTLFDSGNPSMLVFGGPLAAAVTGAGLVTSAQNAANTKVTILTPGTPVALSASGGPPVWSFTASQPTNLSRVTVRSAGSSVNASIASFFANTITYDAVAGTISLS